jgi:hypothetical protein
MMILPTAINWYFPYKRLAIQPSPYNSTVISKPALNYNDAKVFFANFIASSAKIQNIGLKAGRSVIFYRSQPFSSSKNRVFQHFSALTRS